MDSDEGRSESPKIERSDSTSDVLKTTDMGLGMSSLFAYAPGIQQYPDICPYRWYHKAPPISQAKQRPPSAAPPAGSRAPSVVPPGGSRAPSVIPPGGSRAPSTNPPPFPPGPYPSPQGPPQFQMGPPPFSMGPSAFSMGPPAFPMGPPPFPMGPPQFQMGPRPFPMRPPGLPMGPLALQMGPPTHQIGRPAQQMDPSAHQMSHPAHQMDPSAHQMGPPSHQMGHPAHQRGPPAHQMGHPAHQVGLPVHQMGPPAHQMSHAAHQMSPSPFRPIPYASPRGSSRAPSRAQYENRRGSSGVLPAEPTTPSSPGSTPPSSGQTTPKYKSDYTFEKRIGSGIFGSVYAARHIPDGKAVAIKVVSLATINELKSRGIAVSFTNEVKMIKYLSKASQHIIQMYDYIFDRNSGLSYLILELGQQDLQKFLRYRPPLAPAEIKAIWRQLVDIAMTFYNHRIVHLDVKPDNLVIFPGNMIKIVDLGTAEEAGKVRKGPTGSPPFTAVEVAMIPPYQTVTVSRKADVWSWGAVLYYLTYGQPPDYIPPCYRPPYGQYPTSDQYLLDILRHTLVIYPTSRPSTPWLAQHPYTLSS